MRRFLIVLFLLLSLSILAGAAPLPSNGAFVILNDSPLYQDNPDKTLKYLEGLTLGDVVTLMNRTGAFKESGKDRDFARVRATSGKEGWVRSSFIAARATLAIVKGDDSLVFSEPRDVKVTGRLISAMTVVAVMADGSMPGFSNSFGNSVTVAGMAKSVFAGLESLCTDRSGNIYMAGSIGRGTHGFGRFVKVEGKSDESTLLVKYSLSSAEK